MPLKAPSKPIPHGTPGGYTRYHCRCDDCRIAEVARLRQWRARKRAEKIAAGQHYGGCTPVTIRGTLYPSIKLAAEALGTSTGNICDHLARHGHADFVGLGRKGRKIPNVGGNNAKRIILFGRTFPSIRAAADYMGVGYHRLHKAVTYKMGTRLRQDLLIALMAADAAQAEQMRAAA